MKRTAPLILFAGLVALASGCTERSTPVEPITASVVAPAAIVVNDLVAIAAATGATVVSGDVQVTAADMPDTVRANLAIGSGTATGSVLVKVGSNRDFLISLRDSVRSVLASCAARVNIVAGKNNALTCNLTTPSTGATSYGTVQINVKFAPASIRFAKAVDTVRVGVRKQLTVLDQFGATVPANLLQFSSSDVLIARTDTTGGVTGVKAGTATVTANAADGTIAQASFTVIP